MTALTDLAAAWARGDATDALFLAAWGDHNHDTTWRAYINALDTYHGSMDAAIRMNDGLLPGAEIDHMQQFRSLRKWRVRLGVEQKTFTAEAATPARALGLAVILALVEKERK